jgi:hypothetical protein
MNIELFLQKFAEHFGTNEFQFLAPQFESGDVKRAGLGSKVMVGVGQRRGN